MTRFHFADIQHPKRAAKRLKTILHDMGEDLTLTSSQNLVSCMTGYRDWQELVQVTGTVPRDPDDDLVSHNVKTQRLAKQRSELMKLGINSAAAEQVIAQLHLTNTLPTGDVIWQPLDGGFAAVIDGRGWWVGVNNKEGKRVPRPGSIEALGKGIPTGRLPDNYECPFVPATDFCIYLVKVRPDGSLKVDKTWQADPAVTLESGKAEVETMIRDLRAQKRESVALKRAPINLETTPICAIWGEVQKATQHAMGIVEVECDHHGGWIVPPDTLALIPEDYRIDPEDDGYAYYEEDNAWALLVLGLPHPFTSVERENAKSNLEWSGLLDGVDDFFGLN